MERGKRFVIEMSAVLTGLLVTALPLQNAARIIHVLEPASI